MGMSTAPSPPADVPSTGGGAAGVGEGEGDGGELGAAITVNAYEPRSSSPSSAENDVQRTSYSPGPSLGSIRRNSRDPWPSSPPRARLPPHPPRTPPAGRRGVGAWLEQ